MAQRAQALACLLAPALFVLAYILLAARIGLWASNAVFNDGDSKLAYALVAYWASLLMIPAWFALAQLVGQQSPRLAVICAVLGLAGLGVFITVAYLDLNIAIANRGGFPMNWAFFIGGEGFSATEPAGTQQLIEGVCLRNGDIVRCGPSGPDALQLLIGLPIVLYFIANILLGIAVLRTGALPRWSGVLLIAFALLQFDSTGPQPSGLPLLTGLLASLCLLVVYSIVGLRLWRGAAETAIMELYRPTAQA
jgi:hypothetical protein